MGHITRVLEAGECDDRSGANISRVWGGRYQTTNQCKADMAGVIDIANTNTCELYSYVVDFILLVNTTIRKCVIMFEK